MHRVIKRMHNITKICTISNHAGTAGSTMLIKVIERRNDHVLIKYTTSPRLLGPILTFINWPRNEVLKEAHLITRTTASKAFFLIVQLNSLTLKGVEIFTTSTIIFFSDVKNLKN